VPAEIEVLARNFLQDTDVSGDREFVILHRCGKRFMNASAEEADFGPFTFDSSHRGTFCVWELGVVWHEQQAWNRFLLSKRSPEDAALYLNDQHEGPV
jgi:hypothetical protein